MFATFKTCIKPYFSETNSKLLENIPDNNNSEIIINDEYKDIPLEKEEEIYFINLREKVKRTRINSLNTHELLRTNIKFSSSFHSIDIFDLLNHTNKQNQKFSNSNFSSISKRRISESRNYLFENVY